MPMAATIALLAGHSVSMYATAVPILMSLYRQNKFITISQLTARPKLLVLRILLPTTIDATKMPDLEGLHLHTRLFSAILRQLSKLTCTWSISQ